MRRLQVNQDIKPLAEFRAHTSVFIRQVHKTGRPLVITQHGRSAAVLLDARDYESLIEKLELLQDVHTAEIQIKKREGVPHEEARKQVLSGINS